MARVGVPAWPRRTAVSWHRAAARARQAFVRCASHADTRSFPVSAPATLLRVDSINVTFACVDNIPEALPSGLAAAADASGGSAAALCVTRAAGMAHAACVFHMRLLFQQVPPMRIGGVVPVDMNGYSMLFGTNRTPGQPADQIITQAPGSSRHVTVLHRETGRMFTINVITSSGSFDEDDLASNVIPQSHLAATLRRIMDDCAADGGTGDHPSWLTATNRDDWAVAREALIEWDGEDRLRAVETALFMIVLDERYEPLTQQAATERVVLRGDCWFDTCFSICAFGNGRCGLIAEHSYADAPVSSHLWEFCLATERYGAGAGGEAVVDEVEDDIYSCLSWRPFPDDLRVAMEEAHAAHEAAADAVGLRVHEFTVFGKNKIKRMRCSPDAFTQLAFQMAAVEFWGKHVLTYESAATRMFYHGRTETIRPVTNEAAAFVLAMKDDTVSDDERRRLLRTAAKAHVATSRRAASGNGIDRHMLGLRLAAAELHAKSGEAAPEMLSDEAFRPTYRLSTSQTPLTQEHSLKAFPLEKQSRGGGFGPVAQDGVGIAYFITPDVIRFFITCNRTSDGGPQSCAERFAGLLEDALKRMGALEGPREK